MSYTAIMKKDLECNYVNLENRNASDIILPCINQPKPIQVPQQEPVNNVFYTERPIPVNTQGGMIVEGFASDSNTYGGGVQNFPGVNPREGNSKKFCRNGQGCDYSHASQLFHLNPSGSDGETPLDVTCPQGTSYQGVNQKGEIICS